MEETCELGYKLLDLLGLAGWTIAVVPAIGDGIVVIASRNGVEVAKKGATVAEVACDVFEEALRWQRLRLCAGRVPLHVS